MDEQVLNPVLPITDPQGSDKEMLDQLLAETLPYFIEQTNPVNGLIADKTQTGSPASIAVIGFGLSCYIIGVQRGLMTREEAVSKTLSILSFFYNSKQGQEENASGYRGFYYHFLDMQTGRRAWTSEVSTIDTALFIAGVLSSAHYFTGDNKQEAEIRELADQLYRRIDWQWALNGETTLSHGWKPEVGFLRYRWNKQLSEAHLLYILAMGSPTFPIKPEGYHRWTASFEWIKKYDIEYNYAGPLFIHQFAHLWMDLKGLTDDYNKKTGIDYFENSRRATRVHQQYAIENPKKFSHYNHLSWGFTASDGPGPAYKKLKGVNRTFYDYVGELLKIDTGCIVGFTGTIDYDIQVIGGIKNSLFGGEGLFFAILRGPGTVWIQTLPISRLAGRILQYATTSRREEGSMLGGLGNLLDGDG